MQREKQKVCDIHQVPTSPTLAPKQDLDEDSPVETPKADETQSLPDDASPEETSHAALSSAKKKSTYRRKTAPVEG